MAKRSRTALTTEHSLAASYNLVGDVRLTGHEYLDVVERVGGVSIRRVTNRPARYFAENVAKWGLKRVGGRVSPRPSWHDADGRTLRASFDNTAAKRDLGWSPVSDRAEFEGARPRSDDPGVVQVKSIPDMSLYVTVSNGRCCSRLQFWGAYLALPSGCTSVRS